jgi:hypothetical protein
LIDRQALGTGENFAIISGDAGLFFNSSCGWEMSRVRLAKGWNLLIIYTIWTAIGKLLVIVIIIAG